MKILFTLEVNDPDAVEHCMKGLLNKYIYRKNKEYYECSLNKIKEVIVKCDKMVHDEYFCENCQRRVISIDHFYDQHQIEDDDNLYLELVINQYGGKSNELDELICIPINNPLILEKYCRVHLYPYIDYHKIYYQCRFDKIFDLLINCEENIDVSQINDLMKNHNLNLADTILIEIPSINQKGGTNYIPTDEFNKQIIVMKGGGFILPNGAVVYPNGKIVCSGKKLIN